MVQGLKGLSVSFVTISSFLVLLFSGELQGAKKLVVPEEYKSIQEAIDSAEAGDVVFLKAGVYKQEATIEFKEGIILAGEDANAVILQLDVKAGENVINVRNCKGGVIRNLIVERTGAEQFDKRLSGILIGGSSVDVNSCIIRKAAGNGICVLDGGESSIRGCVVESSAGSGIVVSGSDTRCVVSNSVSRLNRFNGIRFVKGAQGEVESSISKDNIGPGIWVHDANTNVNVKGNICRGNQEKGILVAGGAHSFISNNIVDQNKRHGIYVEGEQTFVTVEANTCTDNGADGDCCGIRCTGGVQGKVLRNVCEGNRAGIYVSGVKTSILLQENRCAANLEAGLAFFTGTRVAAEGNICDKNKGVGIHVESAGANGVIKNNRCNNNEKAGMRFFKCSDVEMQANVCEGNERQGMRFVKCSGVEMQANVCEGNGDCGISVEDSVGNMMLSDNRCSKNGYQGILVHRKGVVQTSANSLGEGIAKPDNVRCVIERNICENNNHPGITVVGSAAEVSLKGNRCTGNNYSGIVFEAQSGGEVTGNICENNRWSGIGVRGKGTKAVLNGNKCNNNGAWGIISWAGGKLVVGRGNVMEGNWRGGIKHRE